MCPRPISRGLCGNYEQDFSAGLSSDVLFTWGSITVKFPLKCCELISRSFTVIVSFTNSTLIVAQILPSIIIIVLPCARLSSWYVNVGGEKVRAAGN